MGAVLGGRVVVDVDGRRKLNNRARLEGLLKGYEFILGRQGRCADESGV